MLDEIVEKRIPNGINILIVSEDYDEKGNDRASIVAKGIVYALRGFMNVDANKNGREDLTPARIAEIVATSGCLVVLCDVYVDEGKTPKTHAALRALSPSQPWCYVLPLAEQRDVDEKEPGRCKFIEEAAVMLVEHVAKQHLNCASSDGVEPEVSDCAHRGTTEQTACAKAGCGFCIAANIGYPATSE